MSRRRPNRRARRRSKNPMHLDYDSDLDKILDQSMNRLDEDLARVDDRLDEAMYNMDQKLEKAMTAVKKATTGGVSISTGRNKIPKKYSFTFTSEKGNRITVRYNTESDYSIQTDGDLNFTSNFTKDIRQRIIEHVAGSIVSKKTPGGVPDHILKAAQKISDIGRGIRKTKQTVTFTDRYFMEDPGPAENIWSEDMFGNLKQPLSEDLRMDTKVRVASRPGLSCVLLPNHPKYQVFVDGNEVYMHKIEDMMYRTTMMPSTASTFIGAWIKNWTDEEIYFLQQALQGIVALNLNRKYHDETLSVLDKRLSKQCDSSSDVGDSVDSDGETRHV